MINAPTRLRPVTAALTAAARPGVAVALGVGIPLSGFNPLNNASAHLGVVAHPALVLLMPATLLALLALGAALLWPRAGPRRTSTLLGIGFGLLTLGAFLSLVHSGNDRETLVKIIVSILAPGALFVGLRRACVPLRVFAQSFVVVSTLLLARADVAFFVRDGLPTGDTLLRVKNLYRPYDFHYYGLQNPIPTALFVVTLMTFSSIWVTRERSRLLRPLLLIAVAIALLTLYLLYIRIGLLIGLILVIYLLWELRPSRTALLACALLVVGGLGFLAATGPSLHIAVTLLNISGEARWQSLGVGLRALVHHPVTGLGFGWAEQLSGRTPAHSSIVQAGMEMGFAGFVGTLLLTVSILSISWHAMRDRSSRLVVAASTAAAIYVLYAAIAGGVDAGLSDGLVSVWPLAVAALLAVAFGDPNVMTASFASLPHRYLRRLPERTKSSEVKS